MKPDLNEIAEGEKTIVLCMPNGPSKFEDNKVGPCAGCGCEIMFRPYTPADAITVCMDCGFKMMNAMEDGGGEIEHASLPEQKAELEAIGIDAKAAIEHAAKIGDLFRKAMKDAR